MAGRLVVAVCTLVASMAIGRMALPGNVLACYCAPAPPAHYVGDPEVVVVLGVATGPQYDSSFEIHRIFKGTFTADTVPIRGGSDAECLLPFRSERELLLVSNVRNGILIPSICLPFIDLRTGYGTASYEDVVAAFGPGTPTAVGYPMPMEAGFVAALVAGGAAAAAAASAP